MRRRHGSLHGEQHSERAQVAHLQEHQGGNILQHPRVHHHAPHGTGQGVVRAAGVDGRVGRLGRLQAGQMIGLIVD